MTDYETEYRKHELACGQPFPEIAKIFEKYDVTSARVLDLGCGQGRDALMIASYGHRVHGVAVSPTGISQMIEQAKGKGTRVTGEVADNRKYKPTRKYNVVLLDRVIHMLDASAEKEGLLKKAKSAVEKGGYVLIADIPSNMGIIEADFEKCQGWQVVFRNKSFRFYKKAV